MSFFAQKIKSLRKEQRLSQAALAQRLGITQQAVGKWETQKSLPDTAMLKKLAELFDVSIDMLLCHDTAQDECVLVPIIGTVKAGYDAFAYEEDHGREPAAVRDARDYFYLIVNGDSMEPRICAGDLALVHKQQTVDDGDLAVVLVDGEEATLKRVVKGSGFVKLEAFNSDYPDREFVGVELRRLQIIGRVEETKAKW